MSFRVQASKSVSAPLSGRLLVFVKQGRGDKEVDSQLFHPEATWLTAKEVRDFTPGSSIQIDADDIAFPKGFSALPAGDYEAQAVLDTDHTYNYSGRSPQDWISGVTSLVHWRPRSGPEPTITLDHHPVEDPKVTAMRRKMMSSVQLGVAQREELVSPLLSRFWGHPVRIRAWIILPPGYAENGLKRYPTVYWTHGFGGNLEEALSEGLQIHGRMKDSRMPPMIWVMLDESVPQGIHEFADSVNNGPWGAALISEFLPYLEHKYRMDSLAKGRFLNGHSSGGWATLQLQVNYPKVFGGTWSTSPDPSDFHDFTGADLYAPGANVYHKPDGSPVPLIRAHGKVVATLEQFARLEEVLGPYGGQMSSFDWVFSPKGQDGAPEPMFDRKTGIVNARVAKYWNDNYDLAHLVEATWAERGRELDGRIHVIVGTADTFYLDGSAHRFETVLQRIGGHPHFTYLLNRTHFDLYSAGKDDMALFDRISSEMYAAARPKVDWKRNH
ncbi:MAG: alpha/beta hydrolase [Bryobacteraceae bacterium]